MNQAEDGATKKDYNQYIKQGKTWLGGLINWHHIFKTNLNDRN